jgi:hypothetical protein
MNLSYTPLDIKEIEKSKGVSIDEVITNPTIENIEFLLMKGMKKDKGEITEIIDDLFKEHKKTGILLAIMEALVDGGFLDEQILKLAKQYQEKLAEMK